MQQGIKKLQWLEYLKVVFLEILNPLLCWVFANQVTYTDYQFDVYNSLNFISYNIAIYFLKFIQILFNLMIKMFSNS